MAFALPGMKRERTPGVLEVLPSIEELLCKEAGDKNLGRQVATSSGDGLADWLLGRAWEGRKEGARGRGSRGTGIGLHSRELPRFAY